jgi:hypothetical protein
MAEGVAEKALASLKRGHHMGAVIVRITAFLVAPALAGLLAITGSAPAAEKALAWEDGQCAFRLRFDPAKHDETRLKDTVQLLGFGFHGSWPGPTAGLSGPLNPERVAKADFDKTLDDINEECGKEVERWSRTEFLSLNGVEDYRQATIAEIKDACEFQTIYTRGVRDGVQFGSRMRRSSAVGGFLGGLLQPAPSALRDYQPAAAACSHFIDALEGKSDIVAEFRKTLDRNCSQNGAPARCVERGLADLEKPDATEWAWTYVLDFGWNNCAIKFMVRNADDQKRERLRAALEKQVRRAFKVTQKCESAD